VVIMKVPRLADLDGRTPRSDVFISFSFIPDSSEMRTIGAVVWAVLFRERRTD
jgi:hypothetical protein